MEEDKDRLAVFDLLAYKARVFRKRQKKTRGMNRQKARMSYRKNRAKIKVKSKRRYKVYRRLAQFKRMQKRKRNEKARRKRVASLTPLQVAFAWVKLARKDLDPPLGYPGGVCHVVNRIQLETPANVGGRLKKEVQHGESLSNPEARKIYEPLNIDKVWKYNVILSSHAQYRMDQRGITGPEISRCLGNFFRQMNGRKSKGDESLSKAFMDHKEMIFEDPSLHQLTIVFQMVGEKVNIITTYLKGEPDPRGAICSE
jgi:hypothetical protein